MAAKVYKINNSILFIVKPPLLAYSLPGKKPAVYRESIPWVISAQSTASSGVLLVLPTPGPVCECSRVEEEWLLQRLQDFCSFFASMAKITPLFMKIINVL